MMKKIPYVAAVLAMTFFYAPFVAAQDAPPYAKLQWYYAVRTASDCTQWGPFQGRLDYMDCGDFNFQPVLGDVDHDGLPEVVFIRCHDVYVLEDVGNDGGLADVIWRYTVWPVNQLSNIPVRTAEIADINRDGLLEIISPTGQGDKQTGFVVLQPWNLTGRLNANPVLWRYEYPEAEPILGNTMARPFALGDVDDDGFADIIAPYKDTVIAISGFKKGIEWEYSSPFGSIASDLRAISLAHIDNDARQDVLLFLKGVVLYLRTAWNTPNLESFWFIPYEEELQSRTHAVADINHDLWPEIIVGTQKAIYALTTRDNHLGLLWKYETPDNRMGYSLAVGDIDGDLEGMEIVFYTIQDRGTFVLNAQGQLIWQTRAAAAYPVLANLDRILSAPPNTDLEMASSIAKKDNTEMNRIEIYDLVFDDPAVDHAPVFSKSSLWAYVSAIISPVIGDLNGDKKLEVVFFNEDENYHDNKPDCQFGSLRAYTANFSEGPAGEVVWATAKANINKTSVGRHGQFKNGHFVRGDVDGDGRIVPWKTQSLPSEPLDVLYLVDYLFLGGQVPPCMEAADINDDGSADLTDAIYLLNAAFLNGPWPPSPFPRPGPDIEAHNKTLGCEWK